MDELTEFIDKLSTEAQPSRRGSDNAQIATSAPKAAAESSIGSDVTQWTVEGNGVFRPCSTTSPVLPSGVYGIDVDNRGLYLAQRKIITDDLVILPDTASERVLKALQVFWDAKPKFLDKGQIFKRGVMLWGPPGSGKTCTLMLLTHDIIHRQGIVILPSHPETTTAALRFVRQIEPERPLICVLEDIDEMINQHGEHALLALLDGETQIDNVVFVATTNYPERLDQRFINRPSRFDEIIKIDMPSAGARTTYLRARLSKEELSDEQLRQWVEDTNGMSIAHLKEIVVAVYCLDRSYEETLKRLRSMRNALKSDSGRQVGLRL